MMRGWNPITERRPMLLDVSRLVWRAWRGRAPTGIDRVCLAYGARYRETAQAVIQRDGFRRILSPAVSEAMFALLLDQPGDVRAGLARLLAISSMAREPGLGRIYVNVGHTGLDRPGLRRWIARAGVRPVYMIHDLIPLTHPEYCRAGEAARHAARVATMLDTGAAIIANSRATHDVLVDWAGSHRRPVPPTRVAWLGTEPFEPISAQPPIAEPYFLCLGTIEGRKNHLLLLHVWRALAERLGNRTPKLVLIGARGWEAAQATALLDRCATLRRHVVEIGSCDDATLARYLSHAAALLFPSFAEGYGMPLAEALAIGVPVIASDLPVFRELAGDLPSYRDPTDGPGWITAIIAHLASAPRPAYRAPTWSEHFAIVDRLIGDIA